MKTFVVLATLAAVVMCDEAVANLNVSDTAASSVIPTSSLDASSAASSLAATSAILPTAAVSSALPVSDVASVQSSFISAASSWAASVASIPAATYAASSKVAVPSVSSVPRPYAGPSVISSSNHLEISFGLAAVGAMAFLATLA